MCFLPTGRALFHLSSVRLDHHGWCVLYSLTSKCVSCQQGVQCFISHLAGWIIIPALCVLMGHCCADFIWFNRRHSRHIRGKRPASHPRGISASHPRDFPKLPISRAPPSNDFFLVWTHSKKILPMWKSNMAMEHPLWIQVLTGKSPINGPFHWHVWLPDGIY